MNYASAADEPIQSNLNAMKYSSSDFSDNNNLNENSCNSIDLNNTVSSDAPSTAATTFLLQLNPHAANMNNFDVVDDNAFLNYNSDNNSNTDDNNNKQVIFLLFLK